MPQAPAPISTRFLFIDLMRHQPPHKPGEVSNLFLHARLLQCSHILLPPFHRHHNPRVAARHQLAVHHKPGRAPVAVHIRVDIHIEEMTQHGPHQRTLLFLHQGPQRLHRIQHRLGVQRHVHRIPDIHLMPAVAQQIRCLDNAGPHTRLKQLQMPGLMPFRIHLTSILSIRTFSSNGFSSFT